MIVSVYLRLRLGQRQAESLGVARRHQGLPKMAVKMEIDQGAIHVEQHGINLVPGQGVDMGPRDVCGDGKNGAHYNGFFRHLSPLPRGVRQGVVYS